MSYASHSYPYNAMGSPGGPTGSPSRNQNIIGNVRPPRPTNPPNLNARPPGGSSQSDSKFPLSYMDTEQLKALLDNEERLKEMVEDLDEVTNKF